MRCRQALDLLVLLVLTAVSAAQSIGNGQAFTIVNGQTYTPGLAIIDAPQPFTGLGGDILQLAVDVSGNGRLGLGPYSSSAATAFYNMTAYLYSYTTGLNLTISNGTSTGWQTGCEMQRGSSGTPVAGCTPIMLQEPGSTVKHVNFVWPECLSGDGAGGGDARGAYNISVHQNFRLDGTDYFTIFDLPVSVSNSIPRSTTDPSGSRLACSMLNNPLLTSDVVYAGSDTLAWQPWLSDPSTTSRPGGSSTPTTSRPGDPSTPTTIRPGESGPTTITRSVRSSPSTTGQPKASNSPTTVQPGASLSSTPFPSDGSRSSMPFQSDGSRSSTPFQSDGSRSSTPFQSDGSRPSTADLSGGPRPSTTDLSGGVDEIVMTAVVTSVVATVTATVVSGGGPSPESRNGASRAGSSTDPKKALIGAASRSTGMSVVSISALVVTLLSLL